MEDVIVIGSRIGPKQALAAHSGFTVWLQRPLDVRLTF